MIQICRAYVIFEDGETETSSCREVDADCFHSA